MWLCLEPSTPDECRNRSWGPSSISNCTAAATSSCWFSLSVSHHARNSSVYSTSHAMAYDIPSVEWLQTPMDRTRDSLLASLIARRPALGEGARPFTRILGL